MMERRTFLTQLLAGATAGVVAERAEPASAATAADGDVLVMLPAQREDCSFVEGVRADLVRDVAAGFPADTQRIVRCPLCGDRLVVGATGPLAKLASAPRSDRAEPDRS
jgi:hypothetical protein